MARGSQSVRHQVPVRAAVTAAVPSVTKSKAKPKEEDPISILTSNYSNTKQFETFDDSFFVPRLRNIHWKKYNLCFLNVSLQLLFQVLYHQNIKCQAIDFVDVAIRFFDDNIEYKLGPQNEISGCLMWLIRQHKIPIDVEEVNDTKTHKWDWVLGYESHKFENKILTVVGNTEYKISTQTFFINYSDKSHSSRREVVFYHFKPYNSSYLTL